MANRFDALIDQFDPVLRKAFLDSIYRIRETAQIEQIARMLEKGDIEGAIRACGLDPALFRPYNIALLRAFEAGGDFIARSLPPALTPGGLRLIVNFDVRNPSAEDWLRGHSSRRVTEIVQDQRTMIRNTLSEGISQGLNPRSVALDLVGRIGESGKREGGLIGLTSSQAEWVKAYEAELASDKPSASLARALRDKRFDAAVRRAEKTGTPIPAETRRKMVAAYKNRALRYRAETIGRTEAMAALHQSQDEAAQQGLDANAIQVENLKMVWRTAGDRRVRDSHRSMNGQAVAKGDLFTTGTGAKLRFPGDPNGPPHEIINCRCYRELKYDFLAGVR